MSKSQPAGGTLRDDRDIARTDGVIDKLEFVLALARERHFGRAAEACGVTQPTLSAGLKALEEALGVLVVNRSSRFQGFTPEGERVLVWARRIVGDAQAMRRDLGAARQEIAGTLRIAVIPTALPVVARLTAPLGAAHPGLRFVVLSRTSGDILQLLQNLEVDAGISYLDNEPLGPVRVVPLYREGYRLLTHEAGDLAGRDTVTWEEAGRLPLCLLTPDMQHRRIVDEMLRRAGHAPEPTVVSNSTIVLLTHVRTGRWSTILPPILADGLPPGPIRSIPIVEPEVTHAVGLVIPHREPLAPPVAALAEEAKQLAIELLGLPQ